MRQWRHRSNGRAPRRPQGVAQKGFPTRLRSAITLHIEVKKRIGILTGGGDSPGLNAAIRGAALTAIRTYGMEVLGLIDGFNGLFEDDGHVLLDEDKVQGILALGGTMLGTANRGNPFKMIVRDADGRPVRGADGEILLRDRSEEAVRRIKELNISGLLCIGGDGTLRMAQEFYQKHGVPVVGVPKTIDFDLSQKCHNPSHGSQKTHWDSYWRR